MASVDRRFTPPLAPPPATRFGGRASFAGNGAVATEADDRLPRDRVRDLAALGLLATCLFLVAALATF
ncbi:MAG: hypothetical protein O3A37_11445, partial [Planctomycetota bacterium]|nr:hypothetical protein [Planctomycetota bacterium]